MLSLLKTFGVAIAALMVGAGTSYAQNAPEKPDVTVGLPVTTSTFIPLYLAETEGFFKEEGLNVQLVAFKGGTDLVRGMVAGAVDVGVGALSEALVGVETKQGVKVFYGGLNMAVFDWYAVPKIKSLAEAKGARFGVTTFGSSTDFLTRYALTTHNIDPKKDVRIIQGGGSAARLAAMDAGQLDVNIFATPEKFLAADQGYRMIMSQKEIAEDYPFHVFYARQDFLQASPNTIKALLRAYVKGVRFAKSNKERAVDVLVQKVGFEKKYADRGYDDFIGAIFEDGRLPSEAGMKAFWDMGIQSGTYKEVWPLDRFWDPTYVNSFNQWKPE
jgi:NitT/TauT family transport system substrate-binding protein